LQTGGCATILRQLGRRTGDEGQCDDGTEKENCLLSSCTKIPPHPKTMGQNRRLCRTQVHVVGGEETGGEAHYDRPTCEKLCRRANRTGHRETTVHREIPSISGTIEAKTDLSGSPGISRRMGRQCAARLVRMQRLQLTGPNDINEGAQRSTTVRETRIHSGRQGTKAGDDLFGRLDPTHREISLRRGLAMAQLPLLNTGSTRRVKSGFRPEGAACMEMNTIPRSRTRKTSATHRHL
jgi:hypothetical protein